ncbi:ATP-grasp domain-containing protein [Halosimplex sp. TS25]|uniref:carboxylate--amine ligase n=1 Tax=Halosimplex rarum TaxID=3396619 RepID=UPI0039E91341
MSDRQRRPDAVVVPADHGGSSLACIRSLSRLGLTVIGVASSESAPALASRHCDESHVAPSPGTDLDGYRDALFDLADRPAVRTVVPLYEPDIYALASDRAAFADRVATPWVDSDRLRRAQDRRELFAIAESADVPVPETSLLRERDDWSGRAVVKPRYTFVIEDGGVAYPEVHVTDPGERPDVEALVDEMGHEPIVQSHVPDGGEYGFFAVCDGGDPVRTFQHRRVRSYSYDGGASVYREAVDVPELAEAGQKLLSALDWHGPAMVEFRRDRRDGRFKLLEVNPRFWGSLPLAVAAGVDFPAVYYRLGIGDFDDDRRAGDGDHPAGDGRADYETGVGCHTLRGEASYLHSVLRHDHDHAQRPSLARAVASVALSVVRQPNFDYLAADDPAPFLRDVANHVFGGR